MIWLNEDIVSRHLEALRVPLEKGNSKGQSAPIYRAQLIGKTSPDCFGMISIFPKSFRSGILPDIGPFHLPFWVQFKSW